MSQEKPVQQPGCGDEPPGALLDVDEAIKQIEANLPLIHGSESLSVRHSLGRTLAADVLSTINVPAHVNSAMDGYALNGDDLPLQKKSDLQVVGTSWAGRPFTGSIAPGQCVRIMTGAVMPAGTDTVIMQEQVETHGEIIRIGHGHNRGQNVRQAGEDLSIGQVAVAEGKKIMPAELGLFASLGTTEVKVRRKLRVAFFSTGDELRSVGEPLAEGDLYDSNRYTLFGSLTRLGVELIDMGIIRDHPDAIREAFTNASSCSDVVITTGGVSVGEADFVKQTLQELGEIAFWKLAIRPGRPLAFGKLGNAAFFGLPGNPVAVMVTFYEFVQPALRYMMGQSVTRCARFQVPCVSTLRKRPGRTEYQRGVLQTDNTGQLVVARTGGQGSGILSSMSQANCFIVLRTDRGSVEAGEMVEVEPFEGLV